MKKYFVIGNPIKHSLSPLLHNYWIRENNIIAEYEKKELIKENLEKFVYLIKNKKINGFNVTVPFKKDIIPFLDKLSLEAESTQSVNTIYLDKEKIIGHNTDIRGFELAISNINYEASGRKIFILGAGGVVPSIIYALKKMKVSKIFLSNRTKSKAENLKNLFQNLEILDWGEVPNFDMIINATSLGLNKEDKLNLDFSKINNDRFFYDVIYNPQETNFLKTARKLGNRAENGQKMFIYQAAESFRIWHGINPKINDEIFNLLNQ